MIRNRRSARSRRRESEPLHSVEGAGLIEVTPAELRLLDLSEYTQDGNSWIPFDLRHEISKARMACMNIFDEHERSAVIERTTKFGRDLSSIGYREGRKALQRWVMSGRKPPVVVVKIADSR